jgi:hypothetical protein
MRRGWHSHVRRIRQRLCLRQWILFWKREVCRFHMQPERWLCRAPSILSPVEILFAPRTIPGRIGDVNRRLDERSKYVTAGAANPAAAETEVPRIEYDITRRLFLCGMAGAAAVFLSRPLQAQIAEPQKTIVTPDGIIRTTLQHYENGTGDEFKLVLTTYPPGVGLPLHHHPTVAHNYVLEGVAESQYEGESLMRFTAGDSY